MAFIKDRDKIERFAQFRDISLSFRFWFLKKSDTSDFFKSNKTMKQMQLNTHSDYDLLITQIGQIYTAAQKAANQAIGAELLKAYWYIGFYIVEYEQKGHIRAAYGKNMLVNLAKDLTIRYGKGFSRTNLVYMRLLYVRYPERDSLIYQLTWSHYIELLTIDDDLARSFYEQQSLLENWTVEALKRQKKSALFQRLALSKDKEGILKLAKEGQSIETPSDILRDPYILEFLKLSEKQSYSESDLEQRIIDKLQEFLLELGKGFAFVGRQYRITLNNKHYHVDLVFYHIKLKCYVLIDLKVDKLEHYDIGQMNMYLGYFAKEITESTDNEPIGIILSAEKDDVMVEYAMFKNNAQLFVAQYQLYLPDKAILEQKIREILGKN
jgi:predicted nuclease of restriction endonuclease-like (RecB) superfamily